MQKTISNSGVYLLEIKARKHFFVKSPKFDKVKFKTGYYYYTGSAQKNLSHRIKRHLASSKIINWHIDHVTTIPQNKVTSVFILKNVNKDYECDFVKTLSTEFNLSFAAEGFGNGDCDKCTSHLLYSTKRIDHNHFISRYQSMARLIPSSNFTF